MKYKIFAIFAVLALFAGEVSANTDAAFSFKPYTSGRVNTYELAASETIPVGAPVYLDTSYQVKIATATTPMLLGIAASSCSSSSAGDNIRVYDDPQQLYLVQDSGTIPGSGYVANVFCDIEVNSSVWESNCDAHLLNVIQSVACASGETCSSANANHLVRIAKHQLDEDGIVSLDSSKDLTINTYGADMTFADVSLTESLKLTFTENAAALSSSTGVVSLDFGTINFATATEFTWHVSPVAFVHSTSSGVTFIPSEGAVHPTGAAEAIYAPVTIPFDVFGGTVVIDQITVAYTTDASGDDFDFTLSAVDNDGSLTSAASEIDIGNGGTGAATETILSADYTMTDFAHFITLDVNNANAATDVKFYDIKIEAHLE